jgi:hypothetical protein
MNDMLENFLAPRLPILGLVAFTIQSPDRVLATQCFSKSLYPTATGHLLTGVVHSARTLLPAGKATARYCWTFECLRVYVAARPDGACLALLVENNPGTQMVRIQETLQAFVELPES